MCLHSVASTTLVAAVNKIFWLPSSCLLAPRVVVFRLLLYLLFHSSVVMAQPAAGARPAAAAGAAAAPLPRPVVLPDEFAGTSGEDWVTYLARFNAACVVNGYTPAQRLQFLPCRLTGAAFQVHTAILGRMPNATFPQLCAELTATFNPPQQGPIVEAEFRNRVKKPDESQVEFASALQQLAARAFPGQQQTPLYERFLLNQFIDGQISPELRLHIRSASPPDIDTAVRRALEMGAVFNSEARRAPLFPAPALLAAAAAVLPMPAPRPLDGVRDVYSLLSKISEQLTALSTSSTPSSDFRSRGPPRSQSGSTGHGRCFNCDSPHHFVKDCTRPRRQPRFPSGQRPSQQGN